MWAGWRGPSDFEPDPTVIEQLRAMGASFEMLASVGRSTCAPVEHWVQADCWDSVQAFVCLGSQWRVAVGMSGMSWLGIDFVAVESYLRMRGVARAKWSQILDELLVMQQAASEIMNKRNS